MNPPESLERSYTIRRLGLAEPGDTTAIRRIPIEAPVAIEYNGIGYAVMMATPADLEAYAVGFTLAEGLVQAVGEIDSIEAHMTEGGRVVRVVIPAARMSAVLDRARTRVSESGCGLCGIESIEQILRPLPRVTARIATNRQAIAKALVALSEHQPLARATGAVHAAVFCCPEGQILMAREDVGRHNALDKLIGALALVGIEPGAGFILLSARCSYELVEKTVRAGCPMLVTISAPTSLAVDRAVAADLTLVSLARADSALILNDPHGVFAPADPAKLERANGL